MIIALITIGVVLVLAAFVFGWFNMNSPIQTIIPFPALVLGGALILFGLGGALL